MGKSKAPGSKASPGADAARKHPPSFSEYQHKVYVDGTCGLRPLMTTNPNHWEAAAKERMEPKNFDYAQGGADSGETIRKNREAFQR